MSILNWLSRSLLTETRLAEMGYRKETQADRDALLPVIEFIGEHSLFRIMPQPRPASKHIAKWWKRISTKPELPGGQQTNLPRDQLGQVSMTAKHCLPLLDGMSLGYTIVAAVDINVRTSSDGRHMEINCGNTYNGASQHDPFQLGGERAPGYPMPAIKFHNPWMIKTRPGYSTLFVPPLNWIGEDEDRFTCFAAVVDTDEYPKHVNFPGLFHKRDFNGVIPAGTPLVTAIPFKRADVPKEVVVRQMTPGERRYIGDIERIQNSRNHLYTEELREDRKAEHLVKAAGCPFHSPPAEEFVEVDQKGGQP